MADETLQTLRQAIARNVAAVISLPSAGMLRHHKSRLLGEGEGGLYVQSVPQEAPLLDELVATRLPIGVACRSATTKIIFATPILRRELDYRVNADLQVEALFLTFPSAIKCVQRRDAYRVLVLAGHELAVKMWRIPDHAVLRDKPSALLELSSRLRDLSIGGMGVLCSPKGAEPLRLEQDQRLRVALYSEGAEILLEGRARHISANPDGSLRVGVQFQKLADNLEGRQTLSRLTSIVGLLQREEVRRARLGLSL